MPVKKPNFASVRLDETQDLANKMLDAKMYNNVSELIRDAIRELYRLRMESTTSVSARIENGTLIVSVSVGRDQIENL